MQSTSPRRGLASTFTLCTALGIIFGAVFLVAGSTRASPGGGREIPATIRSSLRASPSSRAMAGMDVLSRSSGSSSTTRSPTAGGWASKRRRGRNLPRRSPLSFSRRGGGGGGERRRGGGSTDTIACFAGKGSAEISAEGGGRDSWACVVLGDLHLNPGEMTPFYKARDEIKALLDTQCGDVPDDRKFLVSLGDLGAYGIAGTTESFENAKNYLEGYGLPKRNMRIVTGNHDLEGMEEFKTDEENFQAWRNAFDVDGEQGQFVAEIPGTKCVLLGLSTEKFRSNIYSSHEVFISEEQIEWFNAVLDRYPAKDGYNIIVFSHAPPMGSGLRVLNGLHVKNTCAWLNHAQNNRMRRSFYRAAREHGSLLAWFSGHFHLAQDYEESISLLSGNSPGALTAFCQTGVIEYMALLRLDLEIPLQRSTRQRIHALGEQIALRAFADPATISPGDENWFSAQIPQPGDGCYLLVPDGKEGDSMKASIDEYEDNAVCWWHMSNGAVLGVHDGLLLEYDEETHAPIGVLVKKEDMIGKSIEIDGDIVRIEAKHGDSESIILRPKEDGSYYRIFQENKWKRFLRSKQQEQAAGAA